MGRVAFGPVPVVGWPARGAAKVIRGEGYGSPASNLRSAFRNALAPDQASKYVGFRIVLITPDTRQAPALGEKN